MFFVFLTATHPQMGKTPATVSLDPTFFRSGHKPKIFKTAKNADWIWAAHTSDGQNVRISKSVNVAKAPHAATLYLAVDNYYKLSIDGVPIASTSAEKDDVEGWHNAGRFDVTRYLSPGSHKIQVDAANAGGPAGVLARLEFDGKPVVQSDASWSAQEGGAAAAPATVIAAAGAGPWGSAISGWPTPLNTVVPYLYHLPIDPVQMAWIDPNSDPDHLEWSACGAQLNLKSPHPGQGWKVLLDFGKELSGRVMVNGAGPGSVTVGTGESPGEAMNKPYTSATLDVTGNRESSTSYSAFRYVSLEFPSTSDRTQLSVQTDHDYYPVKYRGSFACSDPLLNTIWYTGAYTAHLCMQEDIWDAPKRDRARWMGDLHVSGEVINNVFLDRFLMEQTMSRLRSDAQGGMPEEGLPAGHVNGIPGYSCAWIAGLADFYRHTGDLAYVKSQQRRIVSMLDFFKGELDADGVFANKRGEWPFVDWSDDFAADSPQARATTHLFLVKAAREAQFLLTAVGDEEDASRIRVWGDELSATAREHLKNGDGAYGDRRQENAMAVFSGVADEADRKAIWDRVLSPSSASWNRDATPYFNNYVIFAMSELGHSPEALDFIRAYWGGMIRQGATSFWEAYDPKWRKHDAHIHLKADGNAGYFVSLSHGWSAGVTNWLTERVLGIRPLSGGFSECEIAPELCDLAWVEGKVPTPSGDIECRVERSGGTETVELRIPKGVRQAHFRSAGRASVIRSGPAAIPGSSQAGELILGPGSYRISSG